LNPLVNDKKYSSLSPRNPIFKKIGFLAACRFCWSGFAGVGLQPAPSLFLSLKKIKRDQNVLDGLANWGVKFEVILRFIFPPNFPPFIV